MLNQFGDNDPVWIGGSTVLEYYNIKGYDKWAHVGYTR